MVLVTLPFWVILSCTYFRNVGPKATHFDVYFGLLFPLFSSFLFLLSMMPRTDGRCGRESEARRIECGFPFELEDER